MAAYPSLPDPPPPDRFALAATALIAEARSVLGHIALPPVRDRLEQKIDDLARAMKERTRLSRLTTADVKGNIL